MNSPHFRPLTRPELDTTLQWATREGWNPGLHDAEAFWAADPEGFYGLEYKGELIGTGSIVTYARRLGFVGLFIMQPEFRGRGFGRQLWRNLIEKLRERLDPGAPAALDGVFAMQDYYARSGFVFSHRNLRMEGLGQPSATPSPHLVELGALPFTDVCAYDHAHFLAQRRSFLRLWIQPPGGLALGYLRDEKLSGLGIIRPCARGYKIGPLFADNEEIAESLFTALSAHAAGQPIFLDIPENNPAAVALAQRHSLAECFGCARMIMGPPHRVPWNTVYGVTTFELG